MRPQVREERACVLSEMGLETTLTLIVLIQFTQPHFVVSLIPPQIADFSEEDLVVLLERLILSS